jgi:predicted nucleic acid-binding protein
MIVVDTNIIAYLLLPSGHRDSARAALRKDPAWRAPVLWRSEFCNVLALMMRHKGLRIGDALDLMERAQRLLGLAEYRVSPAQVLDLAAQSGCTAYDCEFVALARELGVSLVTADKAVLKAFPAVALSPKAFVSI